MNTTIKPACEESIPVTIQHWVCNGDIDPMIGDYDTLASVAGEELPEAMRWIWIRVASNYPTTEVEDREENWPRIAGDYFRSRALPIWKRIPLEPPFTEDMRTTAQFIAAHGGGLRSSAQARDFEDAQQAIRLVGNYNDFDARKFAFALREARRLAYYKPSAFYGGNRLYNNPNSGRDFYTYIVAWESSFAFYVEWVARYCPFVLRPGSMTAYRITPESFRAEMDEVARASHADEHDMETDGNKVSYRFWWD